MNGYVVASRARWTLATIFTIFLVLNVITIAMVFMGRMPPHLDGDAAMGLRIGMVVVGCIIAYFFAQLLYKILVREDVSPSDSVSPSMSLFAYLVLLIAAFGFLGLGSWLWLPVLFILILIWAVLSLWSLLGWLFMMCIMLFAVVGGALTYLMLK